MAKIIIKDSTGAVVTSFTGNPDEAIGTQAQDAGAPIPFSCGVGACRTCVCKIESGAEHLNREAVGPMHIMVEDDEMLSCISGLNPELSEDAEIILTSDNL